MREILDLVLEFKQLVGGVMLGRKIPCCAIYCTEGKFKKLSDSKVRLRIGILYILYDSLLLPTGVY